MRLITRTVWILSLVSFFTDVASEMLYPVLPLYLRHIGYSVFVIGLLEGVAEAAAGISKGYFGRWSDATGRRVPFVRLGYSLSALAKPLLIVFAAPAWVLSLRLLDRLGKGIRTGARDAILSAEATEKTKGRVFGFHRAMDTLGAVLGPAAALFYLYFHPEQYRFLFGLALLPGVLAVAATLLLKEPGHQAGKAAKGAVSFWAAFRYWGESPQPYRRLLVGLLLFALVNSSDMLLLLLARQKGATDFQVIAIYIFYNLVYAAASYPLGVLADRLGLRVTFVLGLGLFAFTYAGMAFVERPYVMYFLFGAYGLYAAGTEGISKAWISNVVPPTETATAIGTYAAFSSVAALAASSLAGFIWYKFGAAPAFLLPAVVAVMAGAYLFTIRMKTSEAGG